MHPLSRRARSILILKADRLCGEALRRSTLAEFPRSRVVVVHQLEGAFRALAEEDFELVVTGVGSALKGDVLEFISCSLGQSEQGTKTLVVSTHLEERILVTLRALGVTGVFDAAQEDPENFGPALRAVIAHGGYWSDSASERLKSAATSALSPSRVLTTAEQLILAILGDGCDDEAAARKLGLACSTVSTVRRDLHRKLGIQHRGELIRLAVLNGFVRFTAEGVIRPGFAILHAAYEARRRRRGHANAA